MSNTQATANSFKSELLKGGHAFGDGTGVPARTVSTPDVMKAALYYASATINASTTAYSATGEVANSGNYAAGGQTVTMATPPSTDGSTGIFTPSASLVFTSFTAAAFDCALLYNSSQGNKAVGSYVFGSTTITAGTFTLSMPANAAATALIAIN